MVVLGLQPETGTTRRPDWYISLKGIQVDEWKNVWSEYWDDIKDEEFKAKRTSKKRTTKNIWEDELVELDLGGGSEDDDDDDVDNALEMTLHGV